MNYLDQQSLKDRAVSIDGCYHSEVPNNVDAIFIDGAKCNDFVVYADVPSGFILISASQRHLGLVKNDGKFVFEIKFGKVSVTHVLEKRTD